MKNMTYNKQQLINYVFLLLSGNPNIKDSVMKILSIILKLVKSFHLYTICMFTEVTFIF